jgi:hypothetical protein
MTEGSSRGSKPLAIDRRPVGAGHGRVAADKGSAVRRQVRAARRSAVDDGCRWVLRVGARSGLRFRLGFGSGLRLGCDPFTLVYECFKNTRITATFCHFFEGRGDCFAWSGCSASGMGIIE